MFERLMFWRKPPAEIVAPPPPPPTILMGKPIECAKCRAKVLTFVTLANGVRYCVRCWAVISARRQRS